MDRDEWHIQLAMGDQTLHLSCLASRDVSILGWEDGVLSEHDAQPELAHAGFVLGGSFTFRHGGLFVRGLYDDGASIEGATAEQSLARLLSFTPGLQGLLFAFIQSRGAGSVVSPVLPLDD